GTGALDVEGLYEVVRRADPFVARSGEQADRRPTPDRLRMRVRLRPPPAVPPVERLAPPEVGSRGLHAQHDAVVGAAPHSGVQRVGEPEVAEGGAAARPPP